MFTSICLIQNRLQFWHKKFLTGLSNSLIIKRLSFKKPFCNIFSATASESSDGFS